MKNKISKMLLVGTVVTAVGLFGSVSVIQAQEVEKSSRAGTGIYEAVISNKDGYIYVTGAGTRTQPNGALYKIDPISLAIVDSIPLKENPPYGIGINQQTQIVYTTNTRTNSVSAVDLKTGKLLATILNGAEKSHTREVLVDEANNLIYISDVGDSSNIWVIDGGSQKFLRQIENVGKTATGLAFAGDTDKIYVTLLGENAIAVVDVKSGKVEKTFPSGGEAPVNIVSDGKNLFVTNQKSGTVTILGKDGTLIKSIETGAGAIGIAFDPVKNRLYSANRGTGTTTVIDAVTLSVLGDLPTGTLPNHVKVDSSGNAFVINKARSARPVEGQPVVADKNGDTITKLK